MRRKNIHSAIWSVMDVAIYPVAFMLAIPLFIDQMGETLFGLWMLINAVFITGQLFSMGLITATFRNVSKFIASDEPNEVSNTINSNIFTCLVLLVICFVLTLPFNWAINHYNVFSIEPAQRSYVSGCLLLCVPLLIFKFIEQILQNAIKAYEFFITSSVLNMTSRFGQLLLSLGIVFSGHPSIRLILISHIIFILLMILTSAFLLIKIDARIKLRLHFDFNRVRDEIRFGSWVWLQSIFVIITYQGDKLLVMSFFGPVKLAYYSIVSNMFNHIHMCFCALAPWAIPKIAKMMQRGENTPGEFFKIRAYISLIALFSLWLFHLTNGTLLSLWLGPTKYALIQPLITPFILFELLFVFTIAPYMFCNSGGYEKLYTKITFIYTTFNFAGMLIGYFLTRTIEGMIAGLIISTLPGMMIQNMTMNRVIFRKSNLHEIILVFVPSLALGFSMLSSSLWLSALWLIPAAISMYRLFFKQLEVNVLHA